ncbi:MAG TPA: barstar family protein [Chitinophagaceae bacterium]|nr:barstar family protein [Chitinophagaceae bacterium]HNF71885.1 barstar family protein [Chitinophagaceae bacterium]
MHNTSSFSFFSPAIQSRVIIIDARMLPHAEDWYRELNSLFQFPDYFAHNLDSLDELLHDLSWLPDSPVLCCILHFAQSLSTEPDFKKKILHCLRTISNPRLEIHFLPTV